MVATGNVGVAFALVIGAGLCTTLGACAAFFSKLASPKTLAVGLGIAAGVMLYVSFVEIFMQKGVVALTDGGWGEEGGYRYGTLLLFAGMFITLLLDLLVHFVSARAGINENIDATTVPEVKGSGGSERSKTEKPATLSDQEVAVLEEGKGASPRLPAMPSNEIGPKEAGNEEEDSCACHEKQVHLTHTPGDIPADAAKTIDTYVTNDHHRFGLKKMGLLTALAIGIHNLPEGLATFIAALADPVSGLAIAVAIALHNIPEGVCVAMPVYYATGSRFKGFMWAFLSGISEPIGGLLGYALLYGDRMSDVAYGLLFCLVAGMMIYISVMELVPTALKYDPHNKVTSKSIVGGMVIMAASLLAFTF